MTVRTLTIGPWTGDQGVFEVGDFDSINVSYNIDAGDELSFNMSANALAATGLSELAWDCWLYADDRLLQRFRILTLDAGWDPNGGVMLAIHAVSYKRLMNWRLLQEQLIYSQVSQAEIVWSLIQHTQAQPAGDLGITVGTLVTGTLRDRTFERGENIGKLLDDLSGVIGGPFWDIDGERKLTVKLQSDFDTINTPIQLGGVARSIARKSGAQMFANAWYVSGDNSATTAEMALHPDIATDPRGRWELAAGYPSVTVQASLLEKAQGLLHESQSPCAQWSVEIEPHRYDQDFYVRPGDFALLVWPAAVFQPVGQTGAIPCQVLNVQTVVTADAALAVSVELAELVAP